MLLVKLTQPQTGITRKTSFTTKPTWDALAVRIETLFAIPANQVGLTYTDADGDSITISTQDELSDYLSYAGNNVKFQIKRLGAAAGVAQVIPPVSVTSEDHLPTPAHGSPDTVVIQDGDWDANIPLRRDNDTPLGDLPIFEDISAFPGLSSMHFGFLPSTQILRDDDDMSTARIEEVPSSTNSKAHSVASSHHSPRGFTTPRNASGPRHSGGNSITSRFDQDRSAPTNKKYKGKAREEDPISPFDTYQTAYSEAPNSKFDISSPISAAETARPPRIIIPDPDDLPLPPRPQPTINTTAAPQANIYADVAAAMDALSKIMIRSADGTYKNQYVDTAFNAAGEVATKAAQATVDEVTKKVKDTMDSVVKSLSELGSPINASSVPSMGHMRIPSLRRTPSYTIASAATAATTAPPSSTVPTFQHRPKSPAVVLRRSPSPEPLAQDSTETEELAPQPRPAKGKRADQPKHRPWTLHESRDSQSIPPFSPFGRLSGHQPPHPFGAPPPQPGSSFGAGHQAFVPPFGPSPFSNPAPMDPNYGPRFPPMEHTPHQVPANPFYHNGGALGYGPPPPPHAPHPHYPPPPPHHLHMPPPPPAPHHHTHEEAHEKSTVDRQMELMEKAKRQAERAQLRAHKEAEKDEQRKERTERKKRYEKGSGETFDELAMSLEEVLGDVALAPEVAHQAIRPAEYMAEQTESSTPPHKASRAPLPWEHSAPVPVVVDDPIIQDSALWGPALPARGPHHEKTERILQRLHDMGVTSDTHPNLPSVVKKNSKHNLNTPDDEIIERVLEESLFSAPAAAAAAAEERQRAGPSTRRRGTARRK